MIKYRTPHSGLQYCYGLDYGTQGWICFLDPPGSLVFLPLPAKELACTRTGQRPAQPRHVASHDPTSAFRLQTQKPDKFGSRSSQKLVASLVKASHASQLQDGTPWPRMERYPELNYRNFLKHEVPALSTQLLCPRECRISYPEVPACADAAAISVNFVAGARIPQLGCKLSSRKARRWQALVKVISVGQGSPLLTDGVGRE